MPSIKIRIILNTFFYVRIYLKYPQFPVITYEPSICIGCKGSQSYLLCFIAKSIKWRLMIPYISAVLYFKVLGANFYQQMSPLVQLDLSNPFFPCVAVLNKREKKKKEEIFLFWGSDGRRSYSVFLYFKKRQYFLLFLLNADIKYYTFLIQFKRIEYSNSIEQHIKLLKCKTFCIFY